MHRNVGLPIRTGSQVWALKCGSSTVVPQGSGGGENHTAVPIVEQQSKGRSH